MRTVLLILCLLFSAAAPSVLVAQEETQQLNETDFTLTRYTPINVDANALLRTVASLYGRQLSFADRRIQNLTILNDDLVIYETEARSKLILDAIKKLDRDIEPPGIVEEAINKTLTADDMELASFSPKYFTVHDFYGLAEDLYGRQIMVEDGWHQNMRLLMNNNKIVLYEEKIEMPRLLQRLRGLDNSQKPEEDGGVTMMTVEYKPRHVSARGLLKGVQAFQTGISAGPNVQRTAGPRQMASNITLAEESGVIVVRDYPDAVEEILAALKRLDQPAPQVMLTCYVVQGSEEAQGRQADLELQKQLKQMLPFNSYELKALGLMRGTALAGTKLTIDMEGNGEAYSGFNLRMMVGAYDETSGALNLEECRFSMTTHERGNRELFSTATTIFKGEYAVLGVTGADPIFLVVQVHPIQAK